MDVHWGSPHIQDEQCGFLPGSKTVDQSYTLGRVLKGAQTVNMCFLDLEKVFNPVPEKVLWIRVYEVPNTLMRQVWSVYNQCEILVCVAGSMSESFLVRVDFCQGCPLSPNLFTVFMDRISMHNRGIEGFRFVGPSISSLLFTYDVILLAFLSRHLQLSLHLNVKWLG